MHLLFWLSLTPFATGWMGENNFAPLPTAVYGVALLMPAIAYGLLQKAITRTHGMDSPLARALGNDIKGKISPLLYIGAILLALVSPWISVALYTLVALIWLIPDQRIELLRRAAHTFGAELPETRHHLGRLQRLAHGRVESIDDRPRCPGRRAEPLPDHHPEIGNARLDHGRQLGRRSRAFRRGHLP